MKPKVNLKIIISAFSIFILSGLFFMPSTTNAYNPDPDISFGVNIAGGASNFPQGTSSIELYGGIQSGAFVYDCLDAGFSDQIPYVHNGQINIVVDSIHVSLSGGNSNFSKDLVQGSSEWIRTSIGSDVHCGNTGGSYNPYSYFVDIFIQVQNLNPGNYEVDFQVGGSADCDPEVHGCGYGGQTYRYPFTITPPSTPPPTADIKANGSDGPITIDYNTSASISWTSSNANACDIDGTGVGTSGATGSEQLTAQRIFHFNCTGNGGSASDSVEVDVGQPPQLCEDPNATNNGGDLPCIYPVSADIKANASDGPITINYNTSASLSWSSLNATSCTLDGVGVALNGSVSTGNLTVSHTYNFTCTGAGGSASDSVTVNIAGSLPTINGVTISSPTVKADNSTQYDIKLSASNPGGAGKLDSYQKILINYQTNAPAYRGLLVWYPTKTIFDKYSDVRDCGARGFAGIYPGYGNSYIHLDSCGVSNSGIKRIVTFTVHFDPSFTTPIINNHISGYTQNTDGNYDGWKDFPGFDLILPLVAPTITFLDNSVCKKITINWQDNSNNEDGFIISRSTSLNTETEIARVGANQTVFVDTPPSTNVRYYYIVKAFKNSPPQEAASNEVSSFNQPCVANLSNSNKTIIKINGQAYSSSTLMYNGDVLTFQIVISNAGPAAAQINYITDTFSSTLVNIRNLVVSGGNNGGITPVDATTVRLNVSGNKTVGNPNWVITFDATVKNPTFDESYELISNTAIINYTDGEGVKSFTVKVGPFLYSTGKTTGPNFQEVAP